jgi:AAA15 family ATPase/GTPase
MKYSAMHITNFRSIAELNLENFKQINLITGRNNCGKTTVLEALFLISGMSNPELPVKINNFRDLALTSDDNFNFIFHNLDFKQELKINALLDGAKRNLVIKPKYATQYNKKIIDTGKINLRYKLDNDIIPIQKNIEVCFDKINEEFVNETIVSEGEMILKIKKPDLLGNTPWLFKHGKPIQAHIEDTEWLKDFRNGQIPLFLDIHFMQT